MARKRRRDAMASKGAILAAAQEVFATRGFHGASVEQIARKAGVAKGTVFLHFKSKENLLVAMLKHHYAAVEEFYAEAARPEMSAREQLEQLAAVENWLKDEVTDVGRTLLGMWTGLPPSLRARLDSLVTRTYNLYRKRIAALFREFLGTARLEGISVDELAAAFMSAYDALIIRSFMLPSVKPSAVRVAKVLKLLFLDGVEKLAGKSPKRKRARK